MRTAHKNVLKKKHFINIFNIIYYLHYYKILIRLQFTRRKDRKVTYVYLSALTNTSCDTKGKLYNCFAINCLLPIHGPLKNQAKGRVFDMPVLGIDSCITLTIDYITSSQTQVLNCGLLGLLYLF